MDIKLRIPDRATAGEVVEIRTLALAPPLDDPADDFGPDGLPRLVVREFHASFEGTRFFHCDVQPGLSRDLALSFSLRVPRAGTVTLTWVTADGQTITRTHAIAV